MHLVLIIVPVPTITIVVIAFLLFLYNYFLLRFCQFTLQTTFIGESWQILTKVIDTLLLVP